MAVVVIMSMVTVVFMFFGIDQLTIGMNSALIAVITGVFSIYLTLLSICAVFLIDEIVK